ncbi:MAG: hypothetical protein ACI85V_002778, partial [bacterium]
MMAKKIPKRPTMEAVNVHAAAVDVGSRLHMAAVGLVPLTFRSLNSFMRPFVRLPRGFCLPAMNGGGADCRTH